MADLCPNGVFPGLKTILIKSQLRQINFNEIFTELNQQIELFKKHLGCLPDFIDGHQHVHHLPIVRDALLKSYQYYFPDKKAYIRNTNNPLPHSFKEFILKITGAAALQKKLKQYDIPHNNYFFGIYTFNKKNNYQIIFNKILKKLKPDSLIMCHPGLEQTDSTDPIAHNRWQEYQFFSKKFMMDHDDTT